jgi:hypothetical protein
MISSLILATAALLCGSRSWAIAIRTRTPTPARSDDPALPGHSS